jgi:hypothetical protein
MQSCAVRRRAASYALAGGLITGAAPALADSAVFEPALATVAAGQFAEFELYVSPTTLASFDAVDVIIGSNDLPDLEFAYSPDFTAAMDQLTPIFTDQGFYAQDVFVGGFSLDDAIDSRLLVGTVRAATSGLPPGDYTLQIDGATDMISALSLGGVQFEPLVNASGGPVAATVRIPEPSIGLGVAWAAILLWPGPRRR